MTIRSTQDHRVDACHPLHDSVWAKLSISMRHLELKCPSHTWNRLFEERWHLEVAYVAYAYLWEGGWHASTMMWSDQHHYLAKDHTLKKKNHSCWWVAQSCNETGTGADILLAFLRIVTHLKDHTFMWYYCLMLPFFHPFIFPNKIITPQTIISLPLVRGWHASPWALVACVHLL